MDFTTMNDELNKFATITFLGLDADGGTKTDGMNAVLSALKSLGFTYVLDNYHEEVDICISRNDYRKNFITNINDKK